MELNIPMPSSPPPPNQTESSGPEVNEYWQRAQQSLQKINPPNASTYGSSFATPGPYYQMPQPTEMYNFVPNYNPAMLGQVPPYMQQQNSALTAASRLKAEQRLRDLLPQGAPINAFRQQTFNPRGGMRHPRNSGPPRMPMQQQHMQRMPGFRMPTPNVSVKATEGNFVYSDLFSRMIPEVVKEYMDRAYDALPSNSMLSQLEFYLKERITPLLDSGVAARFNWDSEPLPHKINFQVQKNWIPASKMRGSGANTVEVSSNRKRPFENYAFDSKNGSNISPEKHLSKREKKKQAKLAPSGPFGNQRGPQSEKIQKYLNKGIGWVKEGEDFEDAQRRQKRAMRFNDGASSSSSSVQAPRPSQGPIVSNTPKIPREPRRRQANKTSDDVLSYFDRREIEQNLYDLEGVFCPKSADKYQLLLKRDGFMSVLSKLKSKSKSSHLDAKRLGTCPDMCPEKERYMRQVGNLLHPYECNPDGSLNHKLAVKDYTRSAADQELPLPHELRSPEVLQKTMDYLILMCKKSMPRSELIRWYDFLWSRTRSIRKEITQQLLSDRVAVSLVEKCTRFHIYASYCMADLGTKEFDERMNFENLSKCIQTLRHLYDDLACKSIYCKSEAEFRAYDILMNLGDSNALSVMHTYRKEVRNSKECQLAAQIACSFQTDNYVTFFRLIREKATYLQACLCRRSFNRIRSKSFHIMVKVFRQTNIPISKLTELLAFDNDQDTSSFMEALSLHIDANGAIKTGKGYQLHSDVDDEKKSYGCQVIEDKLQMSVPELIAGGTCSTPTFPPPSTSFVRDHYGRLPNQSKKFR